MRHHSSILIKIIQPFAKMALSADFRIFQKF